MEKKRPAYIIDVEDGELVVTLPDTVEAALFILRQRNDEIAAALDPIASAFQRDILALEGKNFESLEGNQQVAQVIQETADKLRVAFSCTKCGEPARFRCAKNASMKTGMFTFAHSVGTHTGTGTIPKLQLVGKPEHGLREKIAEPEPAT